MESRLLKTDLREYPKVNLDRPSEVTLGDLHGNALKFIHALIAEGVLVVDPAHYKRLVHIYKTKRVNEYHISWLREILGKAQVNPDIKCLRLIGDELYDRGRDDILTLYAFHYIFSKLKKNGANIEILLSNHGAEFIKAHILKDKKTLSKSFADKSLKRSYIRFRKTLDYLINRVDKKFGDEIEQILQQDYLPHIKLISYKVIDSNQICLFTHAPVGLETIQMLAKLYGVAYRDDTVADLCKTIDAINQLFRITDLYHDHAEIKRLIWTRGLKDKLRVLPQEHRGYKIYLAHGHEGPTSTKDPFASHQENMFNLDGSDLGKSDVDLIGLHQAISSFRGAPEKKAEKAKKSVKVAPLEEKKQEKKCEEKTLPQDPVASLIAFINENEEKKLQTTCFWLTKNSAELAAAKKLLAYFNQTREKIPPPLQDRVTEFTPKEISYLNNKATPLGDIVRKLCTVATLPVYTASVVLRPAKKP